MYYNLFCHSVVRIYIYFLSQKQCCYNTCVSLDSGFQALGRHLLGCEIRIMTSTTIFKYLEWKRNLSGLHRLLSHECQYKKLQTPKAPFISLLWSSESTTHSLFFSFPSVASFLLLWFINGKITNILDLLSELCFYLLILIATWPAGDSFTLQGVVVYFLSFLLNLWQSFSSRLEKKG